MLGCLLHMGETENQWHNEGIQKRLLQLSIQMRHWNTIWDATTSLKGTVWSKVMNSILLLQQNDKKHYEPTGNSWRA